MPGGIAAYGSLTGIGHSLGRGWYCAFSAKTQGASRDWFRSARHRLGKSPQSTGIGRPGATKPAHDRRPR
jgi:hypothetical protein